ncbi:MAG: hypothetical protein ACI4UM_07715 [Succinivibrio sp.]
MSQDFLYALVPRIAPGPESLIFRRRVSAPSADNKSKHTASKEHKYEKENSGAADPTDSFDDVLEDTLKRKGGHIDNMA